MNAEQLAAAALGREEQRKLVLANVLRILDRAGRSSERTQVAIELAVLQIRKLITGLPTDSLLREQAWRALRPSITPVLERMALTVGRDLVLEAALMVPEQAKWAAGYLQAGLAGDAPGAAALRRATTGANNPFAPRTVEAFPGATFTAADLGRVGSSPELLGELQRRVPEAVMQQVQGMRIQGATLAQWFGSSVVLQDQASGQFVRNQGLGGVARDGRGLPRFAQFGFKSIDRHVRAGFLAGNTTEEIAQNLIADEIRGRMRLGQSAVALKANARAIARTGLAHLAEQVHQQQWAELTEASGIPLVGWQWDASNDSRTCPACSALDRRVVPQRSQLPGIPLHVQCRCQCLPYTETARALDRADAAERRDGKGRPHTGMELTTQQPPAQGPREPRAAYVDRLHREGWAVSQVRGPSGERYWSRRIEWRDGDGSTSGFLGELVNRRNRDPVGAAVTLQEYFGGGPAGAKRGAVFSALVRSGTDPHDALQQLMRGTGSASQRAFVPVADLAKRWPEWADALDAVKPQRSVRQQRQLAKGKPMGLPRRGY